MTKVAGLDFTQRQSRKDCFRVLPEGNRVTERGIIVRDKTTCTRPYRTTTPFRTMGEILQPFILPKQNENRSLIVGGSWSSGMGKNPTVL